MSGAFGKHSQLTFANGSYTVPIDEDNLNEIERMHEITDNFLARNSIDFMKYKEYFFMKNCKQIETFQDNTDWTAEASTTLTDDSTNKFIGSNSVKIAENDATASYVGMYQTISSVDLTEFNDTSASGTSDCIALTFYISDYTKINTVTIRLGTDSSNYYYVVYGSFTKSGWITIYPMKSDFYSVGSPNWAAITWINIRWYSNSSASGEYISPQLLSLFRTMPGYSGYFNPCQLYSGSVTGWENKFFPADPPIVLYYDDNVCDYGIMSGNSYVDYYSQNTLRIFDDTISFISKFEFICKYAGEGPSVAWVYDASNFLEAYIEADQLCIRQHYGGGTSTTSVNLDNGLIYNERYEVHIEKYGDTFRAILFKDGEYQKVVEKETDINSEYDGDVYLGRSWADDNNIGMITNFKISNTEIIKQDSFDSPKIIMKTINQDDSSTTIGNDNELFCYLPPNGLFEVELMLAVDGTDASTDFKTDWEVTGIEAGQYYRYCLGPGSGSTSNYNSNAIEIQTHGFATDVNYGIVASGYSRINEKALCKTGITGGKVQIRHAAQNAGTVTVEKGSYLKITKVHMY